jgi:hypothetical protein
LQEPAHARWCDTDDPNGRRAHVRFEQNEIITLELAFTSSRPGAYTISNASYDRSGRLLADRVIVEPPNVVTIRSAITTTRSGPSVAGSAAPTSCRPSRSCSVWT